MNIVVAEIIGGLGNQMFQYANSKALSLANGRQLQLDLSRFEKYKLHNGYELKKVFAISTPVASKSVLRTVFGIWQLVDVISPRLRNRLARICVSSKFLYEKEFGFEKIKLTDSVHYLSGYWQSEKYFKNYADAIRNEFAFQLPDNEQLTNIREAISRAGKNAVSVHVRRGDYLARKNASLFTSLTDQYYIDAINFIKTKRKAPKFFIFSDDQEWCRKIFLGDDFVFVDGFRGKQSYLDMYLMSICNSNIIANSSFSWWGAYLNAAVDKIVVAPRLWFANQKIRTSDLCPVEWVLL